MQSCLRHRFDMSLEPRNRVVLWEVFGRRGGAKRPRQLRRAVSPTHVHDSRDSEESMTASRWADTDDDKAADIQRKREKEEKKRAKAEKAQQEEDERSRLAKEQAQQQADDRPTKKQKLTLDASESSFPAPVASRRLLRHQAPGWYPSRHVDNFERLNHIEEGSYGWVSRAKETATGEVVALKKLKMDGSDASGFPVTGLREIQCLKACRHRHIVDLREVVVGDGLEEYVLLCLPKEPVAVLTRRSVFLVMEFLEHDLKTLQEEMQEPFLASEIKTLMLQLTSAVDYLHDHWILHVSRPRAPNEP